MCSDGARMPRKHVLQRHIQAERITRCSATHFPLLSAAAAALLPGRGVVWVCLPARKPHPLRKGKTVPLALIVQLALRGWRRAKFAVSAVRMDLVFQDLVARFACGDNSSLLAHGAAVET